MTGAPPARRFVGFAETENVPFRHLWADEDDRLTASEKALADGSVLIDERSDLDLAVVTIEGRVPPRAGHRFGSDVFEALHPMALHNATTCLRLLVVHGDCYRFIDRYESWVQYQDRRPLPRVDLEPLADRLNELEPGPGTWSATPPSVLSPTLASARGSSLTPDTVVLEVSRHLRSAPSAWDPYAPGKA